MSVAVESRKRTTSFSSHRPSKAPRMGTSSSLRRSESMLLLPPVHPTTVSAMSNNCLSPTAPLPYHRTLSFYKEQRQRRKASRPDHLTVRTVPLTPPRGPQPQIIMPSAANPKTTFLTPRTTSPLSPQCIPLPGRPVFPRSKPEPDLYRTAIKMRMRTTPDGQRILSLGPRLALSIMETTKDIIEVTRDLESMVNDIEYDRDGSCDIIMADATARPLAPLSTRREPTVAPPVLTASWVVVKGEDWEMVDCAA